MLYRQALKANIRAFGDAHPNTLTVMNNLAAALEAQGHKTGAEMLYREALEGRAKVLSADLPGAADTM